MQCNVCRLVCSAVCGSEVGGFLQILNPLESELHTTEYTWFCAVLISVVGIFHYSCAVLRETVSLWMLSGPAPTNIATEIWHHHHCCVAPHFFLAQNIFWHEIQQGFTFDNISTLSADNWQGGGWIWLFALFSTILLDLKMWAWLPIGFCIVRLPLPPPLLQKQISTQRHLINSCASHNWTQILILGYSKSKVEQNIFEGRKQKII